MLYRLWKGERVYRVSQLKKKEIGTRGQVKLLSSSGAKRTSFTYRGRQCNWETKRDRSIEVTVQVLHSNSFNE